MCFRFDHVGVEDDFLAAVIHVVVHDRDVVDFQRAEDRDDRHVAVNNRFGGDYGFGVLNDPLFEDLARNERILRHGADGFACRTEELRQTLRLSAVVVQNHKVDKVLVLELCDKREVGVDRFAAFVLRFTDIPTVKILALNNGVCRQGERIALIVGVGLIRFIFDLEDDREDILIVFHPDVHITRSGNIVGEVAVRVHPLAGESLLGRNRRDIIEAVVGVEVNRLGRNDRGLVLIVERDRVGDLVKVGDDVQIAVHDVVLIDTLTRAPLGALTAAARSADRPVGVVALASDGRGKLADRVAFLDLSGRDDVAVAVTEVDRVVRVLFRRRFFVVRIQSRIGRLLGFLSGFLCILGIDNGFGLVLVRTVDQVRQMFADGFIFALIFRFVRKRCFVCTRCLRRFADRVQTVVGFQRNRIDVDTAVIGFVGNVVDDDAVLIHLLNNVCKSRNREQLHDHQDRDEHRPETLAEQVVGQLCHVFFLRSFSLFENCYSP